MSLRTTCFRVAFLFAIALVLGLVVALDVRANGVTASDLNFAFHNLRGGIPCYVTDFNSQTNCPAPTNTVPCSQKTCDATTHDCATLSALPTGYDSSYTPTPYYANPCLDWQLWGGWSCASSLHICERRFDCKTGANSCVNNMMGWKCQNDGSSTTTVTKTTYYWSGDYCDLSGF